PPSSKPGVDSRLDGIVFRALEREPQQRYQRISEVKTDLRAITGGDAPKSVSPEAGQFELRGDSSEGLRRVRRITFGLTFLAVLAWVSEIVIFSTLSYEPKEPGQFAWWVMCLVGLPLSLILSMGPWCSRRCFNYSFVRGVAILGMLPWSLGF